MIDYVKACSLDDIVEGGLLPVEVEDYEIVLAKVNGEVLALLDCCSHQDFPLSHGRVLPGERISWRAHGAEFCLRTGKALRAPAFAPVDAFPVKIENGEVFVGINQAG